MLKVRLCINSENDDELVLRHWGYHARLNLE